MKQILTIILLMTSLFFSKTLLAKDLTLPIGNFESMRKTGTGHVTEIVNPLTVKLDDGRFIDLSGMDFPDLDFYEPGDLAITAVEILTDFLKDKDVIIYQTPSQKEGRINRMGHHIAHLVRADNDVWVQGLLLSLGLTRVRTTPYNPEMAKQMLALENEARSEKSGLWGIDTYNILTPDQAAEHIGSYQIVEGTVQNASMHQNMLYLNFGNNWREDFTVGISAFNLKRFTNQKISPQEWNGKHIRVRGWIKSYNGAYMDIDHPERFEALFEDQEHPNAPKDEEKATPPPKHPKNSNALPIVNN